MSDFARLAAARYSERHFDPEKLPEKEKIRSIAEAARLAPTATNAQAFHMYLIGPEKGKALLPEVTRCYFKAPYHILLCADHSQSWVRSYDDFDAAELDLGIVGSHIALQAQDLGLHSCFICAFDPAACRKCFELPEEHEPIMLIALGYASKDSEPSPRHKERKALAEVLSEV